MKLPDIPGISSRPFASPTDYQVVADIFNADARGLGGEWITMAEEVARSVAVEEVDWAVDEVAGQLSGDPSVRDEQLVTSVIKTMTVNELSHLAALIIGSPAGGALDVTGAF